MIRLLWTAIGVLQERISNTETRLTVLREGLFRANVGFAGAPPAGAVRSRYEMASAQPLLVATVLVPPCILMGRNQKNE